MIERGPAIAPEDYYAAGEVAGFVGAPLLVMTPPWCVPLLVIAALWLACTCDFIGWRIVRWGARRGQ